MVAPRLTNFEIVRELGRGGMGTVYEARDRATGQRLALKVLAEGHSQDPEARRRFIHEATAQARIEHPHIVRFFSAGEEGGNAYIAMEYVEGRPLDSVFRDNELSLAQKLDIAIQICKALAAAHDVQLIHRDVKPQNVLITPDRRVKMVDFGLARWTGVTTITKTGAVVGTPHYMSPEQAAGQRLDHRADIFAFGILLYEMLTGKHPFDGETPAVILYEITYSQPTPVRDLVAGVPGNLESLVGRLLAKSPADRPESLHEILDELRRERHALDPRIEREGSGRRNIAGRFPIRSGRVALAAIFAVLILTGAWVVFKSTSPVSRDDDPPGIAVLPFADLSPDRELGHLAAGITEDLNARFCRLPNLRVIATRVTERLRSEDGDLSDLAGRLRVQWVLRGSIRRVGDSLRVNASLIELKNSQNRWARAFALGPDDLLTLDSVAMHEIVDALRLKPSLAGQGAIGHGPSTTAAAYNDYLKAREYYYRYTKRDNETALELFERALIRDSNFTLAYAGIADALSQNVLRFGGEKVLLDTAIAACNRALRLDPGCAEAHKALGLAYLAKGWYYRSLEANLAALEVAPSYFPAVTNAGMLHLLTGHPDSALVLHKRAVSLAPTIGLLYAYVANDLAHLGIDECAETWFARARQIEPGLPTILALETSWHLSRGKTRNARDSYASAPGTDTLGLLLKLAGDVELLAGAMAKARNFYEKDLRASTPEASKSWIPLALILRAQGMEDSALSVLESRLSHDLLQLEAGDQSPEVRRRIASIHSLLGNLDDAVQWYEAAIQAGWINWRLDERDPLLEPARSDVRFQNALAGLRQTLLAMRRTLPEDVCESPFL